VTDGRPLIPGPVEVLLPSGWRVRGLLPTLGELVRRQLLPNDLLEVALKRADPDWLVEAIADPVREALLQRHMMVMVIAYASEQWSEAEQAWVPLSLRIEDFSAPGHQGILDPDDVDALEYLVRRRVTAATVTAEAAKWLQVRAPQTREVPDGAVPDWAEFRGEPGSGTRGTNRGEVDAAALVAAGDR
jgi:hypothetical protein